MEKNPYIYTGALDPVKDTLVCIRRDELVDTVIKGLMRGDYWWVQGAIGIGKSTFLRWIQQQQDSAYFVYLDCSVVPTSMKNFYKWVIEILKSSIPYQSLGAMDFRKSDPGTVFINFLKAFQPKADKEGKKIILLVDEAGEILNSYSFFKVWQSIFNEQRNNQSLSRYGVVIASQAYLEQEPNSLFNAIRMLFLKDLSASEAGQLISGPFEAMNISLSPEAKQELIERTGGHPQIIQQCCHFLLEMAWNNKKADITFDDVNEAFKSLLNESGIIDYLLVQVKQDKQLTGLIINLMEGKKEPFLLYKKYSFTGVGPIIEGKDGFCAIRNDIFKSALQEILPSLREKVEVHPPNLMPYQNRPGKELIGKSSGHLYDHKPHVAMPCAVKRLCVKNFHGIIDLDNCFPVDARWIFLTGENAFGKTAILRALTIGLFGYIDDNRILLTDDENAQVGVEIFHHGKVIINNMGFLGFTPFTYFAAYGSARLEIQSDRSEGEIKGRSSKTYSLFNTDGVCLNIERELIFWYLKQDRKFQIVKEIILQLLPHGCDITVDTDKNKILYTEKSDNTGKEEKFEPIPLRKLAAGNKSIIAMIGDMLLRFFREYPGEDIHPRDFAGIVIIDELDIHLHPRWLRRFPGILSRVFPGIQFIVSTHSEIPLLGAPIESVFLNVQRSPMKGITLHRVDLDFKNLLPHHLLTSPLFSLDEGIIPEANENRADLRTEENYYKKLETDEIKKILDDFEQGDRDFPGDIFTIRHNSKPGI